MPAPFLPSPGPHSKKKQTTKAVAELGEHPVQPTHSTHEESKAQGGDRSCLRTQSKSGLNPTQSHRTVAPGQRHFLTFC